MEPLGVSPSQRGRTSRWPGSRTTVARWLSFMMRAQRQPGIGLGLRMGRDVPEHVSGLHHEDLGSPLGLTGESSPPGREPEGG